MPFDTFLRAAVAPMDALGCELDLPLGKFFRPADVESNVVKDRLRSRTCCNAMLILIRPHRGNLSVRRSAGRKSQHITRKILESFAIRYANSDLHNIADCRHRCLPFRETGDDQESLLSILRLHITLRIRHLPLSLRAARSYPGWRALSRIL